MDCNIDKERIDKLSELGSHIEEKRIWQSHLNSKIKTINNYSKIKAKKKRN